MIQPTCLTFQVTLDEANAILAEFGSTEEEDKKKEDEEEDKAMDTEASTVVGGGGEDTEMPELETEFAVPMNKR
jgi:hypothetical protein